MCTKSLWCLHLDRDHDRFHVSKRNRPVLCWTMSDRRGTMPVQLVPVTQPLTKKNEKCPHGIFLISISLWHHYLLCKLFIKVITNIALNMNVFVIFNAKISPLNYLTNFYWTELLLAGFQTIWMWFISTASQVVMTYELWQTFKIISHLIDGVVATESQINSDTRTRCRRNRIYMCCSLALTHGTEWKSQSTVYFVHKIILFQYLVPIWSTHQLAYV